MINEKQAILIIAYNNEWTLKKIISMLDSDCFDIYVHIDKKSTIEIDNIKNITRKSKIYVYKEIDVKWAEFSQVEVEMLLLKKASQNSSYMYYHLISGGDIPIKSAVEIYNFFKQNYPKEFVHFEDKKLNPKKIKWIKYYWFFVKFYRRYKYIRILDKISISIQKLLQINRLKNNNFEFFSGANWFSITDSFARYMIQNFHKYEASFKYTRSADEIFLQTMLYNSEYRKNLYNNKFDNDYNSCMREIDWKRGNPYIYRAEDFDELVNSNCMFARKVDENRDKEIINLIYNKVMNEKY